MGRPTLYNPDKNILVAGWARDGLTDEQIAYNLGITPQWLCEWKKKNPEFAEAIKDGKEVVNVKLENAMFQTATGYYVNEHKGKVDKNGVLHEWDEQRWIEPAPVTQIFLACNRMRDKYQNVNKVEHTGQMDIVVKLPESMSKGDNQS